jgi:AraC-like DNA-binding protein
MGDGPSRRPKPLGALVPRANWGAHVLVRHGGGGAPTHLLCGAFEFERPVDHPLLRQLPAIVKVARRHDQTEWLRSTLGFLQAEARRPSPGSELLQAHLLGVAFVQMIRSATGRGESWLTALRDRQIGEALRLMHTLPERRWSVASLGRHVGLSRSTFAARFNRLVGDTPLSYLERWRLDVAAHLLRSGSTGLDEIADRVGYASAPSLVRAFRRRFGVTPGTYRVQSGRSATRLPNQNFGRVG